MKISYVAFPEWSHDIERKFQEFQEAWAMKQEKDQIWIKYMNNKIIVKRGQVKGPGDFAHIVLT